MSLKIKSCELSRSIPMIEGKCQLMRSYINHFIQSFDKNRKCNTVRYIKYINA